ncbi:MAG: inositol monophosphatase family protein [Thermoanaerobaculia bacterium]
MAPGLLDTALVAAEAGARQLVAAFRSGSLVAEEKARNDFVSSADRASERAILAVLRGAFAGHQVLTEEEGRSGGADSSHEWLVDPLDGTANFLQGLPVWAVSVACRRDGALVAGAVLDPLGGNLFLAERGGGARWNGRPMAVSRHPGLAGAFLATGFPFRAKAALEAYLAAFRDVFLAARGIRRCGAATLDLAYTAAGVFDGFFEFRLSPWDIAAGALLIREAGGRVTDLDGGTAFLETGNVVGGSPGVQDELRRALSRHADEATLDALTPRPAGSSR